MSQATLQPDDTVARYAIDVTSGKEIAGPLVRAACERHLRDLRDGHRRGLWFDWSAANRVIRYYHTRLRLAGGEHEGRPFILHPSQQFIVGSIFGWKGPDGFRRFRVAYVEIGKGNGKSPLAAGIGLYMLASDGEPRSEVYSFGADKSQAYVLFRDAIAMVNQSRALDSRLKRSGGPGNEWNLAHLDSGSFFRPISSEHTGGRGKSGPRPHCVLGDELHEHPSAAMVEFMRAGTKGRRQALIFLITNSGVFDTTAVAWNYHDYADRVLRQTASDDSFFAYVCGLDKGDPEKGIPADDWKNPAVWRKANPLLGISIPPKYLQERVREAEGMPSQQSRVRRLNFCEWVGSVDPFVDPELWQANGGSFDLEALVGRACVGGLDLSSINDLAALVLLFKLDDGRKAVLSFFWKAKELLREHGDRDHAPYEQWAEAGHLLTTPGKTIWYDFIVAELDRLSALYNIKGIAYDRWKIKQLEREAQSMDATIKFVEHGQGFSGGELPMEFSIAKLEDDLGNTSLMHGNHPVLEWCAGNTRVISDAAENRKFDKRKAIGRIDGMVALAMAEGLSEREDLLEGGFETAGPVYSVGR